MNAGPTAERVYDALKRRILSGEIGPGEKLDPAAFADELTSSVTPVRDALHQLAGERLVESRTSEGFHLPLVTEPGLRDLYAWNDQLVRIVVHAWPRNAITQDGDDLPAVVGSATRSVFEAIASRSINFEHAVQIDMVNDRLAAPRVAELHVLPGLEAELKAMAQSLGTEETTPLLKLIGAYHRRRMQATPAIVRALYRT